MGKRRRKRDRERGTEKEGQRKRGGGRGAGEGRRRKRGGERETAACLKAGVPGYLRKIIMGRWRINKRAILYAGLGVYV